MTRTLLLVLLVAASSLVATVKAAAAACEGMCEIPLNMNCTAVYTTLEFMGECCSLEEIDGECFMVTTKDCSFKRQGANATNCVYDQYGNPQACLPAYTLYLATNTDEDCPESDFPVPQWTDAPTMGPTPSVSDAPSYNETYSPTAAVTSSFAVYDTVAGDPTLGDCYTVERMSTVTTQHPVTGCRDSSLTYTYYNGGYNADYVDTGYDKTIYHVARVQIKSECNDEPAECTISVDGVGVCNGCSYSLGFVTMTDCSNLDQDIFPPGSQTAKFFGEGSADPYDEQFFNLAFDEEKCNHPAFQVGTYTPSNTYVPTSAPTWVPLSEAPSYIETYGPSIDDELGICEVPPDMNIWMLILPATPDPLAYLNLYHGDPSLGDCYSVKEVMVWNKTGTDDYYYCCTNSELVFYYYNGGIDIYGVDSGYPQESYETVRVVVTEDCGGRELPPTCTISVDGLGFCDQCRYDVETGEVVMEDCSNLEGVFPDGTQTIAWSFSFSNEPESDPANTFFSLAYEEERCNHPVFSSLGPSTAPSWDGTTPPSVDIISACETPPDHFLSAVGIPASPDISFQDVIQGDVESGDCYSVERSLYGFTQTSGADPDTYCCSLTSRNYIYYNGGIGKDGIDTGYPKETYATIRVSIELDCGVRELPPMCVVDVDNVGTCGCYYDESSQRVALHQDCDSLGVFAVVSQDVSFTRNLNDDDDFFRLAFDEDRCSHPTLLTSYPTSIVISGPGPTFAPPEEPPTWTPWSDVPTYVPMPSTMRCYDDTANGIVEEGKCHAIDMYYCVEEWEDGCTQITGYYDYYNQYTTPGASSRVTYHYLSINSVSGCDPDTNPGQPANGCLIDMWDNTCNECFSDGDMISMTDCTNAPDVFDPPKEQIISLAQGGQYFDVVQTTEMCNHPSVTASSDSTRGDGIFSITDTTIGTGTAYRTMTFPIDVTLHFSFFEGQGEEPDQESLQLLVVNTINFFHSVFLNDETFSGILLDIEMLSVTPDYSTEAPDDFTVTLVADIVIDVSDLTIVNASAKLAALTMAHANLNEYLRDYVRHNPTGQRNVFYQAKKVHFKAVGSGKKQEELAS